MNVSIKPQVRVALICDDIRKEINGKEIVIGIVGDEITTPTFPAGLIFSLYLRLRFPEAGAFPTEFRVLGPPLDHPITPVVKTVIQSSAAGRDTTAALVGIPVQIMTPGKVQVQWRPSGSEGWETVVDLDVRQGDVNIPGFHVGQATFAS